MAMMDLVVVLHTHLPYVIGHGRWPHGSDWLMEAVIDSYLPFLDVDDALGREGVAAPVTLGVTPVLAAQLAMPEFATELREFLAQRLATCDEAERELLGRGEEALAGVVRFWRALYHERARSVEAHGFDLLGMLRSLEASGRIELTSSAATHGFLPLMARDESIRLQLLTGRAEHERLFGRTPAGCWLPECAYRPRGPWAPWAGGPHSPMRDGIETHLGGAGYKFVTLDAHLAGAGRPLEAYGVRAGALASSATRSAYRDYVIGRQSPPVRALVRDPLSTRQVWSRDGGYPGGDAYLEFHKIRWPGGLKLWEVTGPGVSLGDKRPYDPRRARALAAEHARHFVSLLERTARQAAAGETVIVAPFDAELFGHWWFEGLDFIGDVYRGLAASKAVRPVTASAHLRAARRATPLDLPAGSWGRDGDFSMWLNPGTAWTWTRLWALEERFWNAAPAALADPSAHLVLAQAARELLLAQSSDWQFIISTGEVADYGERRFRVHADAVDALVAGLEPGGDLGGATARAEALQKIDGLFPGVLDAVAGALAPGSTRARVPVLLPG